MKNLAIGLGQQIGEHVQPPAMGHAEHDLLHAQLPAAFDDLFQRGDHRFAAIDTETLGAEKAHAGEFLEAFRLDQLVQDGALAFRGEGNLLVRSFDAALQPVLLLRIVDVHELIADGPAIGAAQIGHDLARGGMFQPHHPIHENGTVHILVMEAVERRIELGMGDRLAQLQRVKVRFQMADHAIGAHQLDHANGLLGAAADFGLADHTLFRRPLPGQRADQLAAFVGGAGIAAPGGAPAQLGRVQPAFAQFGEPGPPARLHRIRVFQILGVKRLDEMGIGAIEKRGRLQNLVGETGDTIRR